MLKQPFKVSFLLIMAKKYLKIVFANRAPRFWDVVAQPEI